MSGITLKRAQEHLEAWLNAELAVSKGQSYQIGSRMLKRANLSEIRKQIQYWENKIAVFKKRGQLKVMRAVPRDL